MAEPIRILVANEPFEGSFTLAGPMIVVSSAYGTKRAVLGLFKPHKLAKTLLRKMINDAQAVAAPATPALAQVDLRRQLAH